MESEIEPGEPVSGAVVRAVSAVNGHEMGEGPPLNAVLDPDALDALFAPSEAGNPRTGGTVSFVYGHCRVSVEGTEYLTIEPLRSHHAATRDDADPN